MKDYSASKPWGAISALNYMLKKSETITPIVTAQEIEAPIRRALEDVLSIRDVRFIGLSQTRAIVSPYDFLHAAGYFNISKMKRDSHIHFNAELPHNGVKYKISFAISVNEEEDFMSAYGKDFMGLDEDFA